MSDAEVQALRDELAKAKERNKKLKSLSVRRFSPPQLPLFAGCALPPPPLPRGTARRLLGLVSIACCCAPSPCITLTIHLAARRPRACAGQVVLKGKADLTTGYAARYHEEKQRRAMAEQALQEKQREVATAVGQAEQALQAAQAAAKAAGAARSEAAAATQQLAALRGQLELLQSQQSQQRGMLEEMQRWRAALALAAGGGLGGGAPAAALPAPLPAAPAAPAPGPAASPRRQRQRQQGPASPRHAPPAARKASAAAAPPPPPPPPPPPAAPSAEETRAKAVAARQAAAGGKRPRGAADAAAAPAQANVFADLMGDLQAGAKRPRQAAAPAPVAAAARAAAAPAGQQRRGAPPAAPAPAAAAPGEPSLAVSANELHVEQQREQATAVEEAAQQLGRITAGGPGGPGGELSVEAVRQVAAELHRRLIEERLPLPLLLSCFESAVLACAAAKPQMQYLQLYLQQQQAGGDQQQAEAAAAAAAAAACPAAAWFEAGPEARGGQQQAGGGQGGGSLPAFAAVWSSREALAGHHLPWLLHCAAWMQQLERQYAGAAAAAAGSPRAQPRRGGQPLLASLRQHLHRLVLGCCLAARRPGGKAGCGGSDFSSALRHTETEVCTLAAAAAGLCRATGDGEVRPDAAGPPGSRCSACWGLAWLLVSAVQRGLCALLCARLMELCHSGFPRYDLGLAPPLLPPAPAPA